MGPGIRVTCDWQLVAPGLFPGLPRRSQHPIHQSTGLLFAGGTLSFQKWSKKKKKVFLFVLIVRILISAPLRIMKTVPQET